MLLLCPYPPYPPRSGGALRIYHLLMGIARTHTVWCLTFVPDAQALTALAPLRQHCHVLTVWDGLRRSLLRRAWSTLTSPLPDMALRNASHTYSAALAHLLARQHFDVVQAESIEMAGYALEARRLWQRLHPTPDHAHTPAPRLLLDQFNAEYVLQRRAAITDYHQGLRMRPRALLSSGYSWVQWQKLAAYERMLLRRYDHVLVVSQDDREALQRLHPATPMTIVPNGVDTHTFSRAAVASHPAATPTLVFTGTLDFRPNIDAVLWFAGSVLPLVRAQQPAVRLVVVGRNPVPAIRALDDGERVQVHGDVADVRPFIASATLYVLPMRMGGGVRLKLLEALAMEVPVVSTRMGASGVPELRDGAHIALADSPAEFAAALLRLLDDATLRQRMGEAGRALVCQHYDWQVVVPRLEGVYRALQRAGDMEG
jgi:glycosyltransferase involved in cell wall biosynthesis